MTNPLSRWSDRIYALSRIVAGALFACHGAQKLFGVLGGHVQTEAQGVVAGVVEFVGGVLIAVGLFTVAAAFVSSGEMAVAYFRMHAPNGFWPIQNKGELAVIYCFLFLFVAARGAGPWSLDGLRRRPAAAR